MPDERHVGIAADQPDDTAWVAGPNLGGLLAEAVGAYAIWRAVPADGTTDWRSGKGADVLVQQPTVTGVQRINVKRAWRAGAPVGQLFCAPLTTKTLAEITTVDIYALVVLEDDEMSWEYRQLPDGTVKLEAHVSSAEIYYLPFVDAVANHLAGTLRPHGNSKGRWVVSEASLANCRALAPSQSGQPWI
jgi:hypothetical protein